ncbi:MAG TPA: ATP-binding protein [Candidatus Aquilonibacter sp.]|nr:ATP-binding protein [Candidatus Aquilonibacter sp.]
MSSHIVDREDGQSKRTLHLRIPPDPVFARTVRDAIIGFGSLHGIDEADLEALLFAVGEALANAIEHSASGDDIEILAEIDDRRVVATVIDRGRGLSIAPPQLAPLPSGLAERGRGIPIMQRCTDIFNIKSTPGKGTAITLGRWRKTYENAGRADAS